MYTTLVILTGQGGLAQRCTPRLIFACYLTQDSTERPRLTLNYLAAQAGLEYVMLLPQFPRRRSETVINQAGLQPALFRKKVKLPHRRGRSSSHLGVKTASGWLFTASGQACFFL